MTDLVWDRARGEAGGKPMGANDVHADHSVAEMHSEQWWCRACTRGYIRAGVCYG